MLTLPRRMVITSALRSSCDYKMTIKVKDFIRDRISCQVEREQREFPVFGVKKMKIVDSTREESLVEVMKRVNDYVRDTRVINIESIWSNDSNSVNNLATLIGYRVFYEE